MRKILFILFCLTLIGCATMEEKGLFEPSYTSSKYFSTKSAGFDFEKLSDNTWGKRYTLLLEVTGNFPTGAYLETYFQNPQDIKSPFMIKTEVKPTDKEVFILSPMIDTVATTPDPGFMQSRKSYEVIVYIYRDKSKFEFLGYHRQLIRQP